MPRLDSETLDMFLSTLNDYAERNLTPDVLLKIDHEDVFPMKVLKDLYDPSIGLHLIFVPEDCGGVGAGAYDIYRVSTVMAEIDLGIATGVLATCLGADPILVGATPEQKKFWMTKLADEGLLMAYGATEPQAGSDLAALTTVAERIEKDGQITGYRITGRKQWISNGGVADLYTVLANAPGGPSWFIVEKGLEGFTPGKPEDKHGIRASNTTALFLENVEVGADRLVGGVEGKGLAQAQAVFGYTRLMVAAFGLGAGWGALKRAIKYSQQRIAAGAPLSQKQGYTHKLIAPNAIRLEAARAYIEWTADRLDSGEDDLATEGAVAKYFATESGNKASEDAIQALGGYGYTREYMVEKYKRDVRITTIYEGTSEIMEWTMARDRWQLHLKTRGGYYLDWAARLEKEAWGKIPAATFRSLGALLERCRLDRLTRNQHILFRLGELIAWAETAAIFAERAHTKPSGVLGFSAELLQKMARVHAREAFMKVASDGLKWAVAAGQTDSNFATTLNLAGAVAAQAGMIEEMDQIARQLNEVFPAE
ncbi:MAG: acyl-CoA dehydrogenase family protein [Thermoanaerobaculia bacterium]|nr:Crotonobetainyl-CoA dehydrogenase [Thermoanaerobaculia bacterium]MCK6684500.1 acyl-CoA dehydrogenase family protein [Thermoanaerobaculia bacterium]